MALLFWKCDIKIEVEWDVLFWKREYIQYDGAVWYERGKFASFFFGVYINPCYVVTNSMSYSYESAQEIFFEETNFRMNQNVLEFVGSPVIPNSAILDFEK